MAYNSLVTRSDAAALIPENVARDIMKGVAESNPVLQLAQTPTRHAERQNPYAGYERTGDRLFCVGDTGLKQTSEVAWENKYIDAEELAVIVPIPEAVLDDAGYDIWAEVDRRLSPPSISPSCKPSYSAPTFPPPGRPTWAALAYWPSSQPPVMPWTPARIPATSTTKSWAQPA